MERKRKWDNTGASRSPAGVDGRSKTRVRKERQRYNKKAGPPSGTKNAYYCRENSLSSQKEKQKKEEVEESRKKGKV